MSGEVGGLKPVQAKVAALLALGLSVRAAAAAAGCSERSVHNWLKIPEFAAVVVASRDKALASAVSKLSGAASAAVDRLVALMGSADENIALRAATTVLEQMAKIRSFAELAGRVAELESRVAGRDGRHHWG